MYSRCNTCTTDGTHVQQMQLCVQHLKHISGKVHDIQKHSKCMHCRWNTSTADRRLVKQVEQAHQIQIWVLPQTQMNTVQTKHMSSRSIQSTYSRRISAQQAVKLSTVQIYCTGGAKESSK
jgi:hypothetical protein